MIPFLLPLAAQAGTVEPASFLLPPAATEYAKQTDFTWNFILITDVVFFIILMGMMILFAVKYKQRQEGEKTDPTKGSHLLEAIWAVVPSILLLVFFALGFQGWINQAVPPADSLDVRVTGQKWSWTYEYGNGIKTFANLKAGTQDQYEGEGLVVPAGKPIRLTMSSQDVIHSFYVPDFRIKKDVLASRYTVQWFNALEPGEHQVYCTEYCGTAHSRMMSRIKVLSAADYSAWLDKNTPNENEAPEVKGQKLFAANACGSCHSIDGSKLVGPSLKGKYGTIETLEGGATAQIDDTYIRESILMPAAKVVAGYAPSMPAFQGRLSDDEINNLIAYIKTLQ